MYDISGFMLGFTVATALIGTIVGALCAGKPVDHYGRKKSAVRDRHSLLLSELLAAVW